MAQEIEVFRITPLKGFHYYAVLANRKYYDEDSNTYRYFAYTDQMRFMGQFEKSYRTNSGIYVEVYMKDGVTYDLQHDYNGNICLERAYLPTIRENNLSAVQIDKNIVKN